MTPSRRRYWSLGTLAALAILAFTAVLAAEVLLNRPSVIRRISAMAASYTGGPIHVSAVRLSLFFSPHVTIEDVRAYLPGRVGVTVRRVTLHPSLKGLLTGGLPIGTVHLKSPTVSLALPDTATDESADTTDPVSAAFGALAALAERAPGLKVVVDDGRLTISGAGFAGIALETLEARLSVPAGTLSVGCSAAAWDRLKAELQWDTQTLASTGDIRLEGLDLAAMAALVPAIAAGTPKTTDLDLSLRFKGIGARITTAEASLDLPELDWPLPGGTLSLKGIHLTGDYADSPQTQTIRLDTLSLEQPRVSAAATLTTDKIPAAGAPRHRIAASADSVDIGAVRSMLDAALGRHPIVAAILDIVRGGRATDVAFAVSGDTPASLGSFQAMVISGRAEDAVIQVPGVDLPLDDAAGRFLIRNGILYCEAASARTGSSHGTNGNLMIDLTDASDAFTLSVDVAAHLPDLPPVLGRILPPEARQWLDRIVIHDGRAAGTLTLGERLGDLQVAVDVSGMAGSASVDGLVHRLALSSGQAMVTGKTLAVKDVCATLGASAVTGFSGRFSFSEPLAEIHADRITLASAEIYPQLIQKPELAAVASVIDHVSGTVTLEKFVWKGDLTRPVDGLVSVTVNAEAVTLSGSLLPGPVKLSCRQVALTPRGATITEASLAMSDTHLALSGQLTGAADGLTQASLHITGSMGDAIFRHLASGGRLPPQLIIRPPLNITDLTVNWIRHHHLSVTGDLHMAQGPQVSVDATLAQEDIHIRSLRILDAVSDGTFMFRYHRMGIAAGFTGHLLQRTVDQLLAENTLLMGALEGAFVLSLPLENPAAATVDGWLRGHGLKLPDWQAAPLQVHTLDLRAQGRQVDIAAVEVGLLESRLTVTGNAAATGDAFHLALSVAADRVDLERWLPALKSLKKTPPPETEKKPAGRPISGAVSLTAGSVTAGRLTWAPVAADITLTPESMAMVFTKAEICGINHPGRVAVRGTTVNAQFSPSVVAGNLNQTLNCLHDRPVELTGTFDLNGTVSADGPWDDMARILSGDLHVRTSAGEIYKAESLENIFAMLNLPGLIGQDLSGEKKSGLAYDLIAADIGIGDGVVTLEKGVMKGPLMQLAFQGAVGIADQALDVTVFVVPLKSLVSVVSKIPLFGRILTGDIISIPVKISGTLKEPQYIPLSPDAVGLKAVRLLKEIINMPVQIIQPLIPEAGPG